MRNKKNVLLITFHDWKSNRLAGFHFIAKSFLIKGYDVGFCSHKRPILHAIFNVNKIHNIKNWAKLFFSKVYQVKNGNLRNFTGLDFTTPKKISVLLGDNLNNFLQTLSDLSLAVRCKIFFPNPSFIIIESGSSVFSYRWLRKIYKGVPFIYRPSDPCVGAAHNKRLIEREKELFLNADLVLLVNEESQKLYDEWSFYNKKENVKILPNAIDLSLFQSEHPCPKELINKTSICYVGGHPPDLNLIYELADKVPKLNIVVICPERLLKSEALKILDYKNISYIEGVCPDEVPKFIYNSTIIMIPYKDAWKKKPLGMHGKIMQAMACKKPLVCKNLDPDLSVYGIHIAKDNNDFISIVQRILKDKIFEVDYKFKLYDWDEFCEKLAKILKL